MGVIPARNIVTKSCQQCHIPFDIEFVRGKTHQKFCSEFCRNESKKPYHREKMRRKRNGTFMPKVKTPILRVCKVCNKQFKVIPYRANSAYYCSRKCYYEGRHKTIELKCAICAKKISIIPSELLRSKRHYCSIKCRNIAAASAPRKKKTNKNPVLRPLYKCPICQRSFKSPWTSRKNGEQKRKIYCSRKCMALAYRKVVSVICLNCGKKFITSPSTNRRFCSTNCFNTYLSQKMRNEYKQGIRKNPEIINQFCTGKRKRSDLGNQFFRSSWEANFARFLNYFKIDWVYEPKRFALSDGTTYLPDFYMPEFQYYFEIKGWFKNGDWKKKTQLFSHNHQIVVIDKNLYQSIERCFSNLIPNWEKSLWSRTKV